MKLSTLINNKIKKYNPKGNLAHTAKFFLELCDINHFETKEHMERVAILAEATAKKLKKDYKAAFFAGLLHDVGKLILPSSLFDGHNISQEEYTHVKEHAKAGYKALKKFHMFTAMCAGLHHNMYKAGYGVDIDEFPDKVSPSTVKKILEISTIISICDFVDAYNNRETKIKDGSDANAKSLKEMLYEKYPNDIDTVDVVLKVTK